MPACGFSIVNDTGTQLWKLIRGYGGGPDTWCNTSKLGGDQCYTPPTEDESEDTASSSIAASKGDGTCSVVKVRASVIAARL